MSTYQAGWYPDYYQAGQLRYWDGDQWTQYVNLIETNTGSRFRRGPKRPKFRPSAQLVSTTYRMLFEDRSIIALLVIGSVLAAMASGVILFPATYWGHVSPDWTTGGVLGVLVAGASLGAAGFVMQLVTGAVVAAANLRAEGLPATRRDALRVAWSRRRQLLAWAIVSTVVGSLIRILERMGIGGLIAALTVDVGWAFATVFATPVIIAEGTMPGATIRRSSALLKGRFSVVLISNISLALPWIVLAVMSTCAGIAGGVTIAFANGAIAVIIGGVLVVVGALGFCFSIAVSSALSAFLETYLYRYAVGLPVPGVDQHLLPPLLPG